MSQPVALHFRNVGFQYEGAEKPALRNLNFSISLKQHTSLIGTVGSGKSTLLKLMCAEMIPTLGVIEVEFDDGGFQNLWHEDIYRKVRKHLGYMPQEAYLSNTSLAVNVSMDTDHASEDVMQAIRLAELESDIGHWAAGTNEEVGETGVNLSGGQKQRVNLARALYSKRPYLVLDDPLSAVDAVTEAKLMQTLLNGPEGFLLCSHRLTELRLTDRILVLEHGRIVEDGVPSVLMDDENSEFNRQLKAGEK